MTKIDKGTAGLLASLEERSAQVRELEREIEALGHNIRERDSTILSMQRARQRYHETIDGLNAKIKNLQDTLATMDGEAIKFARKRHDEAMAAKDKEIACLREDLHRCLGWIASSRGQHPAVYYGRPQDRFDALTMQATDGERRF